MRIVAPNDDGFRDAVTALRSGGVVAHPTETVYGLAVDPFCEPALDLLRRIKGRDAANPILLIIDSEAQLPVIVPELSRRARQCIARFWPGALTLLLPAHRALPASLLCGRPKVAVRCPAHAVARRLCREAGIPLTSTSANLSGEPPALAPATMRVTGVSICIDGGVLAESAPSTVYDPDEDHIIRQGVITADALLGAIR